VVDCDRLPRRHEKVDIVRVTFLLPERSGAVLLSFFSPEVAPGSWWTGGSRDANLRGIFIRLALARDFKKKLKKSAIDFHTTRFCGIDSDTTQNLGVSGTTLFGE